MTVGGWPLVGRDEELVRLHALTASGSGSAVVVGEMGVGKSRLVVDFLRQLGAQGISTTMVRATRSTATIPFGPFAAWAPDRPWPTASDRLHVLRAIASALLEGDQPVVVGVDDAHLLDDGSAALVLHLVAATPARVVAMVRSSAPCPDAVVALWKEGLAGLVSLRPLSEAETVDLVERVLTSPVEPAARRRLWSLTTGTPLYVREILRTAIDQDVLALSAGRWRWQGELRGSERLVGLLGDRLNRLDAGTRRILEILAVGEPLPVELVAQLDAEDALEHAEQEGLVMASEEAFGAMTVRLAHPLYGEVLRSSLPHLRAQAHQRTLAAAAVAVGWQERHPLRVASWWLESGALPDSADVFVAAARQALALAEWGLADRMGRAAEEAGAGADATLLRAAALVQSGGWGEADDLLAGLSVTAVGDDRLADFARIRAGSLAWRHGQPKAGLDLLIDAAARLRGRDRARVLVDAAFVAVLSCDPNRADRLTAEALDDAGSARDLRVQALAVAALAWALQGRIAAAVTAAEMAAPWLRAALAGDRSPGNPAALLVPVRCLGQVFLGRPEEARRLAEAALEDLADVEPVHSQALILSAAGHVALLQGQLAEAQRHGRAGIAAMEPGPTSQWPAAVLAASAAQLGQVATAEETLDRVAAAGPPIPLYAHLVNLARAWVLAARGDRRQALMVAETTAAEAARVAAWTIEMLALVDLARLGAPERAARRLAELADVIEGPYSDAVAAYATAAAARDGDGLDTASDRLVSLGALLLAAESAGEAAAAHLAAGRHDRHLRSLQHARALAARCDGARTPSLQSIDADPVLSTLTAREREVVTLAAQGHNNREIARRLYVSIRTVNAHLRNAYVKLGTSDRAQLAELGLPTTDPDS